MWVRSIIEGDHGVQLKTLPKAVPEGAGSEQPGCGKGFSSWEQSGQRSSGKAASVCSGKPGESPAAWRVTSSVFKKVRN